MVFSCNQTVVANSGVDSPWMTKHCCAGLLFFFVLLEFLVHKVRGMRTAG